MNDREAFLTRWSRRKREAAVSQGDPLAEKPAEPAAPVDEPSAASNAQPVAASELPRLAAIDAGTDVRAFLEKGVPQDLTRAALRRVWSSDPAIRDFVGLSENAWDFTAPDGVPGFGPFAPDAARDLVARVFGDSQSVSDAEEGGAAVAQSEQVASNQGSVEREDRNADKAHATEAAADGGVLPAGEVCPDDTAMQKQAAASKPPTGTPDASDRE
jgi:hypothetical protein